MIELRDVTFSYGSGFSLSIDRLTVERNVHAACIGPSGCGKTTLINLITGNLLPSTGDILFDEIMINKLSDAQRRAVRIGRIGMVFQEFELLEYLSALDNILLPFHVGGRLRIDASVRQRAHDLAEAMGITHTLRRSPRRLSQGERQRVAICRALVSQPDLIMCDEPTGNLDPGSAKRTLDLLFEQAEQRRATLFMVTHNHQVLDRFDQIIDMTTLASAAHNGSAT